MHEGLNTCTKYKSVYYLVCMFNYVFIKRQNIVFVYKHCRTNSSGNVLKL